MSLGDSGSRLSLRLRFGLHNSRGFFFCTLTAQRFEDGARGQKQHGKYGRPYRKRKPPTPEDILRHVDSHKRCSPWSHQQFGFPTSGKAGAPSNPFLGLSVPQYNPASRSACTPVIYLHGSSPSLTTPASRIVQPSAYAGARPSAPMTPPVYLVATAVPRPATAGDAGSCPWGSWAAPPRTPQDAAPCNAATAPCSNAGPPPRPAALLL